MKNDEFFRAENTVHEKIEELRTKNEERNGYLKAKYNKDNNLKRIKQTNEIKKEFEEVDGLQDALDKIYRNQSHKSDKNKDAEKEKQTQRKNLIRIKLRDIVEIMKEREKDVLLIKKQASNDEEFLLAFDFITDTNAMDMNGLADNDELTDKELQAKERWKDQNNEIDKKQEDLVEGLDEMTGGLKDMEYGIQSSDKLMADIGKDINQLNKNIEIADNSLKAVLEKHRKPEKICLDIIQTLLVLVLIGILIHVAQQ